jgi:predicted membrane protein
MKNITSIWDYVKKMIFFIMLFILLMLILFCFFGVLFKFGFLKCLRFCGKRNNKQLVVQLELDTLVNEECIVPNNNIQNHTDNAREPSLLSIIKDD